VTDRNLRKPSRADRPLHPFGLPLFVVSMAGIVIGCFPQADAQVSGLSRSISLINQQTADVPVLADDPALSMPALSGRPVSAAEVVVLPQGSTIDADRAAKPRTDSAIAATRWLKTTGEAKLWSSAGADATTFTNLPAGTFLRLDGAQDGARLPVYYAGDGLLRRSGDAWVDAAQVETIDAPPPGKDAAVDAAAKQALPVWVQAHRATRLWSGPDDKAVTLSDLPQWTFLKIAGLERDGRLLVNYAGDYAARQPGIGWVDQAAVGPAADPGVWVTNHRATALWSGVDDKAARFNDLPQWTKLRLVEGAPVSAERVQIQFFGDGRTRQPGAAWIARADIGPITPPVPLPAVQPVGVVKTPEARTFASDRDFISTVGAAAQRSRKITGVPASVTVAQAILESDWGRSRLTRQGNNLFGIKALNGSGSAGVVTLATWEHLDDSDVVVQAPFRAYTTLEDSVDDHGRFFRGSRYRDAMAVAGDARAFARAIQDAGYATDPSYASKLIRLMDRYDLYRFDQ
jgi:hypothetical protein